jgi:hypothetical protein
MRHLDDGQIAELIDSADGRTGGPADRGIEAHLSECAACRERVEEARQIAARARSILATAVPVVPAGTSVPPFDEILHRAGQGRRAGKGGGSLRWLAWAATLVVAGGLGWYARGEFRVASRRAAPLAVNQPAVEADAIQPADDERRADLADAAVTRNEQAAGPAGEAGAATPPPAGRLAEPAPPRLNVGAQREGFTPRDRLAEEAKAAAQPAPSVPAPLPIAPAEAARRAREAALLRPTPPTEAEQAPGAAVTTGLRVDMLDRRIVTTREQAEQTVGGTLAALEGLPIDNYYVLPAEPGVIQTEQTLPRGGKLELEQWRVSTARSQVQQRAGLFAQRAMADSVTVAAESLQVGDLWIVARGSISADSLRVLLRKLRR